MTKRVLKKDFVEQATALITSNNKLGLIKLLRDTNIRNNPGHYIGLKQCKDFMEEHLENTTKNIDLMFKFVNGKIDKNGQQLSPRSK